MHSSVGKICSSGQPDPKYLHAKDLRRELPGFRYASYARYAPAARDADRPIEVSIAPERWEWSGTQSIMRAHISINFRVTFLP
jgi:hypothetical protein